MKTMKERYEEYRKKFGLAYQKPMTYEEFVEFTTKQDEEEAKKLAEEEKHIGEARQAYEPFVKEAEENDRFEVLRKMDKFHDDICKKFFAAGDKARLGAYYKSYKKARRAILPPKKHRRPCAIKATQVYDDDDRPTTHTIIWG